MAIALSLVLLLPAKYSSSARIDIDLEGTTVRTLEPIAVSTYADQYVAKLQDRVLSNKNLRQILENKDIFPEDARDLPDSERARMIRKGFFVSLVKKPATRGSGRTVDLVEGFRTGYVGTDPEFAFAIASFAAKAFIDADVANRTKVATSTSTFLNDQIKKTEAQIVELEGTVADFKVQNACCLPELKELNMDVIQRAERDIESLQPRLRTMEQERQFLQSRLEEVRRQSVSTDRLALLEDEYITLVANYGPDHPDIAKVRRQIEAITSIGPIGEGGQTMLDLRVQLAEAQRRYSDEHPDVVRLKRQIASFESGASTAPKKERNRLLDNPRYQELRSQINALDTELNELRTRAPELRRKIAEYEERLTRTPQIESEYQAINRKLSTARENFDNLQQRAVIARQTEALELTDIGARLTQIESAGLASSPIGPPRVAIGLAGVFVAITVGLGLVILAELADSTVRSGKDVESILQTVPIATIPIVQNSLSKPESQRQLMISMGTAMMIIFAVIYLYTTTIS